MDQGYDCQVTVQPSKIENAYLYEKTLSHEHMKSTERGGYSSFPKLSILRTCVYLYCVSCRVNNLHRKYIFHNMLLKRNNL